MNGREFTSEKLANAISDIGETIVEPSAWPIVMDKISGAIGATGAFLIQADVRTPDVPRTASLCDFVDDYFRHGWHTRDVRAARGAPLLLSGHSVVVDQDILTKEEIAREPLYNECNLKHGLAWFAGIKVWTGQALWAMAIQRSVNAGPFSETEKGLLGTLSRPLSDAASLSALMGYTAINSATNALGVVGEAAIAIGRKGEVLGTNSAAEMLFDQEFFVVGRRLRIKDSEANREFQDLSDRLTSSSDTEPLRATPIIVRRTGKAPLVLREFPIHGAARTPFLGARSLLICAATDQSTTFDPSLLSRVYGLTQAEARVAVMIAAGKSVEEVASHLRLSRGTITTQLKAVFQKTDVHRQSELVALLARFRDYGYR
ncbi:helix-turn-helix transcriptional regulator [Bradyrhizobium sp. INPA01-394B]|uniref:Helix-turn-helix transcriptional regulator n=1 Tax=Bradyrhizobium campsiandrae TaxID=1729892 RepID=A0ABR7UFN0_9BRAD|nr:helix-turn-helix transcriptional regulator [Bradyrhizobium campsiandrae]MBC9878978.1 helix-turn-helix transcriptional regulator [Bradyrhizobium campsiandrae]MBC9982916.1 helix-turn-helix transcriptional regulator [Bradyrhizobium campsiandrae]